MARVGDRRITKVNLQHVWYDKRTTKCEIQKQYPHLLKSSRSFPQLVNRKGGNKRHRTQSHEPADKLSPSGVRLVVIRYTLPLNYIRQDDDLQIIQLDLRKQAMTGFVKSYWTKRAPDLLFINISVINH